MADTSAYPSLDCLLNSAPKTPKKVGMLGGTFDPPHLGHLLLAEHAKETFALDAIVFVVANDPWQKADRDVSPVQDRLEMVALAVEGNPDFYVSSIEQEIGGPSYTSQTLLHLNKKYSVTKWFTIIGSDAAASLDTWHNAQKLKKQTTFLAATREASEHDPSLIKKLTEQKWQCEFFAMPQINISSTDMRQRVADGRSITYLTTASVINYIGKAKLYQTALR